MTRAFILLIPPIALCFALLSAGAFAEIVSREGPLVTVVEEGEGYLDGGTRSDVKEKAKKEATRKAIELAVGVHIAAQSTMENFELAQDVVESYSRVYIRSLREISYEYDAPSETGRYKGEFVIDSSTMASMAEAERVLLANQDKPVEATVFLFDGEGRMIQDGGTVRQGDRFNLMVQPFSDIHAYIIGRDSSGNLFNVFPNDRISSHENPLRAGVQYYFPPRNSTRVFEFDDVPGQENFHFLFSAVPLADMDALFEQLNQASSEASRKDLAPIIQERMATRGFQVTTTAIQGQVTVADERVENAVGVVLKGSGAFVKTVVLSHVR